MHERKEGGGGVVAKRALKKEKEGRERERRLEVEEHFLRTTRVKLKPINWPELNLHL